MTKSRILKTTVLIAGIYYVLDFLLQGSSPTLDEKFFKPAGELYSEILIVLGAFAVGVGVVNIFKVHLHRIFHRRENWANSIVLLTGFLVIFTLGILK